MNVLTEIKLYFLILLKKSFFLLKKNKKKFYFVFNTQYIEFYCHFTKTIKRLRTKFQKFVHSLFEQKTLNIKKLID
jgi:hypothetical protein